MRIDTLEVQNFKKFESETFVFPQSIDAPPGPGSFHVLIGDNGAGKTSILDALAVALGVWLEKPPDTLLTNSRRRLSSDQKRLIQTTGGDRSQLYEAPGSMTVHAKGTVLNRENATWGQTLPAGKRNVSNKDSKQVIEDITSAYERIQNGENVVLPVVAYYGAGRTWLPHNQRKQGKAKRNGPANRWEAFYDCLNDRIRLADLNAWFRGEAIARGNRGTYRPGFDAVLQAAFRVVPGADGLEYDPDREEIILSIDNNPQPFSNLSAGQRSLFALVTDVAVKMVTQNNFLVPAETLTDEDKPLPRVLAQTPGVVLIDELDVHLHPTWQRSVVETLQNTFPSVQFVATTHSPFIVQSLRQEELINLQGQSIPELGNLSVGDIAQGLMRVDRPDVGRRYQNMVDAAKDYLTMLDEAKKAPAFATI